MMLLRLRLHIRLLFQNAYLSVAAAVQTAHTKRIEAG